MRFRFPLKRDEIPVAETRQRQDDTEASNGTQEESKGASAEELKLDDGSDIVNPEFQHGVQSAQAMTQVWSKQHLIMAFVM